MKKLIVIKDTVIPILNTKTGQLNDLMFWAGSTVLMEEGSLDGFTVILPLDPKPSKADLKARILNQPIEYCIADFEETENEKG